MPFVTLASPPPAGLPDVSPIPPFRTRRFSLMSNADFDSSIQILLVDDDDIDARVVTRGLTKHGVSNPLFVARDGLEALEHLRGEGDLEAGKPTLVLLDLRMPRMDGLEFLSELRNDPELRRTVVLVLTTSDAPSDLAKAYDLNVAGYLLKQEAGRGFSNYVPLIQAYLRSVRFPPNG